MFTSAIHDGRLDADVAGASVEHDVDGSPQVAPELLANVASARGTDGPEAIGRRRRYRAAERLQKRERDRVVWHPQGNGLESPSHYERHTGASPQDECQGPRPEALGQKASGLEKACSPILDLFGGADVYDVRTDDRSDCRFQRGPGGPRMSASSSPTR